ncbi:MAG: diguanylate cyclase [Actinomycetota bacterium]|nr:diguanylate cyclase [Actinomycetota bacterium]
MHTEADRLLALDSFKILDTPPESAYDDLTELAAHLCGAPMSAVSLVDSNRQWFKSRHGFDLTETARDLAFCERAEHREPSVLEVPDASMDQRFADHPMVLGEPFVRFYAGAPLVLADGNVVGTLCVFGPEPHSLSEQQRRLLAALARQVVGQLELRRQAQRFAAEARARLVTDAALREQQRVLSGLLEHTDVLIYAKDVDGRFVMSNKALDLIAPAGGPLLGLTDYDLFDRETAEGYRRNDARIRRTRVPQVFSETLVHPDGSVHTYRSTKFPLIDDDGVVIGVGGVSTDVTELADARAAHAAAEKRWRTLVEQSPIAVTMVDAEGTIVFANTEAARLCGTADITDVQSRPMATFDPSGDRDAARAMIGDILAGRLELRAQPSQLKRLDGEILTVELSARAVDQPGYRTVQFEFRDMTALAKSYAELKHSASTDPLTGLLNRRAWDDRLRAILDTADITGCGLTIAVVDLDHFKIYNDTHGHDAGDVLLQRFTTVAGASLRRTDVFARWGGEEFLIALPDTTLEQARQILGRVRRSVPADQTCSIGYTAYHSPEPLSETLSRADKALYLAKSRGRNRVARA